MPYTPLELKLREEILLNAGLMALLNKVAGFDLPGAMMSPPPPYRVLAIQRISTARGSTQERGIHSLAFVRVQFTAWCKGPSSEADALAVNNAMVAFLNNFDATSNNQFGSPAVAPVHSPNFIIDQRVTRYAQTQPPLYLGITDARIYNREDL